MTLPFYRSLLTVGSLCLLCTAWLLPTATHALDLDEVSSVRLAHGWVQDDGTYMAAIVVDLAPGWKTYWRTADENGLPPRFDWRGSRNVKSVQYLWPTPQIFVEDGVRTIGFKTRLVLPVLITPVTPGRPVSLELTMEYGVCADICVPTEGAADLSLALAPPEPNLVDMALMLRPQTAAEAGLTRATCGISSENGGLVLRAGLDFDRQLATPRAVVVEPGSDLIWISATDYVAQASSVTLEADMMYLGGGTALVDRTKLRFTLLTDDGGIEVVGCASG